MGPKAGGQEKDSSPAKAGAQADFEPATRVDSGPRLSPGNKSGHIPERKCILSGKHDSRSDLIRLALGPDGSVAPDVRARAPGRGAWIGVDRAALEQAQAKGRLKAALARAFKTGDISIPAELGERIEAALRKAALDRLGLEARAGTLLTGSEKIEVAARRGGVHMLLHASDAGEDGSRRLDQALRVGESGSEPLVFPAERAILSLALGRQNVVHIALIDRAAAARVRHALDRWRAFIGLDAGLKAATAGTPNAAAVDVNEG
jgi:predicted RNA-binding protein YlxR (DUF448 family)